MLILVLRIGFVILASLVGLVFAQNVYVSTGYAPWLGGALGFAISVTLIAAETAFQRHFTRSVVAFLVGIGGGLLLSILLLAVLKEAIQSESFRNNIDIPLVLVTTYLVVVVVLRNADRFRVVVPFIEFSRQRMETGQVVLDLEALADARLTGLAKSGLFGQRLIVHRSLVKEAQLLAEDDDPDLEAKGKRCLSGLADLRVLGDPVLQIDTSELPASGSLIDGVIDLARLLGARILAGSSAVIHRAQSENLPVIDMPALSTVLSASLQPGDLFRVRIEREGEGKGQGVGFHVDGSMVIVNEAESRIGHEMDCVVQRLHHTANGRMVFALENRTAEAAATTQRRRRTRSEPGSTDGTDDFDI